MASDDAVTQLERQVWLVTGDIWKWDKIAMTLSITTRKTRRKKEYQ